MNNPDKLSHEERAITPVRDFGKGINHQMSQERRGQKQDRHRKNTERRLIVSKNEH